MPTCTKCGAQVTQDMSFCAKCGAPVKIEQVSAVTGRREYRRREKNEKGEKREKEEKGEKTEKKEKGEYGFLAPLVGGLILIMLGITWWLSITQGFNWRLLWAFFLVMVGAVIIIAAIYGAFVLRKRHPRP